MKTRIKLGDIFEIPTKKGLAYAQYIHAEPLMGTLIRVLPGFHQTRPADLPRVASQETQFVTFFALQAALEGGIVNVVGNERVPEALRTLPVFRARGHIDRQGNIHSWWLLDGQKKRQVSRLNEEQKKLPIRETVNDTLLIERIEQGWTPEKEPTREPGILQRLFSP